MNNQTYKLTDQQKRFVKKAKAEGFTPYYDYSGRGMFGRKCPAVNIDHPQDFSFKGASQDNMGLGIVVYMP